MKRLSATLPVRRLPTCDDALQCVSNLLLADLLEVTTRCKDGSLVHQVLQVSTSEAGGPAAQTTADTAINQHEQRNLCRILYASCTSHSLPDSLAITSAATQHQMLVQRIQDHTCHQRILPPVTLLPPGHAHPKLLSAVGAAAARYRSATISHIKQFNSYTPVLPA